MDEPDLTKFKVLTAEAIKYGDVSLATKLLVLLRRQSSLTAELQEMKTKLQWIKFPSLSDEEAYSLLQAHLEVALQIPDYDVADKIGKKIVYAEVPIDQVAFMQGALTALGKNNELIGGVTIKDLIKGYYDFRSSAAMRSNLDEINYVNQSSVTKGFKDEEKALLLTILKITDSLRNGLQKIQAPITDPREEEFPADFDYSTLIPGIIRSSEQSSPAEIIARRKVSEVASTVAQPSPVRPSTNFEPVPISSPTEITRKAAIPAGLSAVRRPPVATVNMQDVLNRRQQGRGGVVFDGATNVKVEEMSQRIEAERQSKQTQIDKKLEELKKRKT